MHEIVQGSHTVKYSCTFAFYGKILPCRSNSIFRKEFQYEKKLKKTLSAVIASAMIMTSSLMTIPSYAEGTATTAESTTEVCSANAKSYKITSKKFKTFFFNTAAENTTKLPLYFMNGSDVPYYEIDDAIAVLKTVNTLWGNPNYDLKVHKDGDVVTLIRENDYFVSIDCAKDQMYFLDYNAFFTQDSDTLIDLVLSGWKITDTDYALIKTHSPATERYGSYRLLEPGIYCIDLVHKGNKYYIPVQTVSDVFLAPTNVASLYIGRSLIIYSPSGDELYSDGKYTDLGMIYYGKNGKYATGKVSKTMSEFNICELCFAFDYLYGLKEQHHISSFADLILEHKSGYKILGTNSKKIDESLFHLVYDMLDDVHSKYVKSSYASGAEFDKKLTDKYGQGRGRTESFAIQEELENVRKKYYPDGVPGYEEVGDTAYITLDTFTIDLQSLMYYAEAPTAEATDTIGIIAYSVQQILREGSPNKNVVLDLSCNIGGPADAAVYTIAAFLGKASVSVEDPNTGALVINDYKADTNFDGKYNSKDALAGKGLNLYCLTSKASFSCGNFVPCVFKEDNHVSIIGQRSGGGACSVMFLTTAIGSVIRISSSTRLSYVKNGSFYDIDQGAEPDYAISKYDHFYDRKALTEYIDNIF